MRRHRETAEAMLDGAGWDGPASRSTGLGRVRPPGRRGRLPRHAGGDQPHDLDRRKFQRLFERRHGRWTTGQHDGYPEPYAAFVARVRASFGRACAQAGSGRTVVVVSSGGPVAVVCADLADPQADAATAARLWARFNAVMVNPA